MVPTRADSPHVPISAEEIAEQVLSCAEIGVTSVHLHTRYPDQHPAWEKEHFAEVIQLIRSERPDLVVCVTTSGRTVSELAKRADVLLLEKNLKPDMASLTLASMNFALTASVNAPQMVQDLAAVMLERGIIPELEIFDTGMLNYFKYLVSKGLLKPPYVANLILGGIATAQATPLDLGLLVERLPPRTVWSVGGIGRSQLTANVLGLASGGGVRVGLEDNLHFDSARKRLATNRELVSRVVEIAAAMDRFVMSPSDFRRNVLS
jgi:3-keto-5-aminohexanoate cleavage enzyme